MTTLNPYITFNGNCELAFNFYKSIFGGDFSHIGKFKDMPKDPKYPVAEADKNKIMHVSLPIGKGTILMGSDTGGELPEGFIQGNNFSISINTESRKEADRLFDGLSHNGKIIMPMNNTFWNSYFGMFTDQFGIQWMVSFDNSNS